MVGKNWKTMLIGAGVSAGIGVGAYILTDRVSKLIEFRRRRKHDEPTGYKYEDFDDICDYGMDRISDEGDIEQEFVFDENGMNLVTRINGNDQDTIVLPVDLDNDPEALTKLKDIIDNENYEQASREAEPKKHVNPRIEVKEYYDDFGVRVEGYVQKAITYLKEDDVALYFDEDIDQFVSVSTEDIYQGTEYALDNGSDEVFVANHDAEIVFDILVDSEHNLQEVLDDANQYELTESTATSIFN